MFVPGPFLCDGGSWCSCSIVSVVLAVLQASAWCFDWSTCVLVVAVAIVIPFVVAVAVVVVLVVQHNYECIGLRWLPVTPG